MAIEIFSFEEKGDPYELESFPFSKRANSTYVQFKDWLREHSKTASVEPRSLVDPICLFILTQRQEAYVIREYKDFTLSQIQDIVKDFTLIKYGGEYGTSLYLTDIYANFIRISAPNNKSPFNITLYAPDSLESRKLDSRLNKILALNKKDNQTSFKILIRKDGYLSFEEASITAPSIDLDNAYGFDFKKTHNAIVKDLSKNESGVFIFRGPPGGGKTTYIKYLSSVINRPFIYIPEIMCGEITSPDFLSMLLEEKGAVLVFEDAERAVSERDGGPSPVSNILNICDGILGDMLRNSVIITFNSSLKVDKALVRKGRCKQDYEFRLLTVEEARAFAKKIGKDESKITAPMPLCDIYNLEVENGVKEKSTFAGFST